MKKFFFVLLVLTSGLLLGENKPLPDKQHASPILANPDLKTFADLIIAADLYDLFQGTGPFTVFAPNNAAFEKLGQKKLRDLQKPQNKDQLANVLIYHIIPGKYLSSMLKSKDYKTLSGKTVKVDVKGNEIEINGKAKVVQENLVGPNGVIHVVDTVLTD